MFQKTRIRLTAWYLLIIMIVSIMFSSIIYRAATFELTRFELRQRMRMEQRIQGFSKVIPLPPTPELIEETKERILWILFILNSGIFLVAGFLGYILAGRTLQPIQQMMEEQNRFISDASHELKTPLTSLKSAMEVHLREKKPSQQETNTLFTESILEVDKLEALSDSLLQLAQYQQPHSQLSFSKLSIENVINKAVQKMKPIAGKKNIVIKTEVEDGDFKGNEYSLIDLFIILLDNAIKYSPEKSTVSLVAKKTDNHIKILVNDEGSGIASKDAPYIFDRFYRADTARTKNDTGGYGLGLSIAKKIVELHKGSVRLLGSKKKGTTFEIIIPVKQKSSPSFFS